jgi:CheY-like chemotaxis protein
MDRREILVVDDNIFNVVTLQTILEYSLKIQSDKALNGKEAVEKVLKRAQEDTKDPCHCLRRRQNYKLIFMDCNMPIMDGFQATLKIREHFT